MDGSWSPHLSLCLFSSSMLGACLCSCSWDFCLCCAVVSCIITPRWSLLMSQRLSELKHPLVVCVSLTQCTSYESVIVVGQEQKLKGIGDCVLVIVFLVIPFPTLKRGQCGALNARTHLCDKPIALASSEGQVRLRASLTATSPRNIPFHCWSPSEPPPLSFTEYTPSPFPGSAIPMETALGTRRGDNQELFAWGKKKNGESYGIGPKGWHGETGKGAAGGRKEFRTGEENVWKES